MDSTYARFGDQGMATGEVLSKVTRWICTKCPAESYTTELKPHTRYHRCPGMRGLSTPFTEAGVRVKVVAHDREDYVGQDIPQKDQNGRPVMSITVTRDDGEDVYVLAPTSVASLR